ETMSSTEEVAAAVRAARSTGLPVAVTMTFDTAARSMMGVLPADFAKFGADQGVDFLGANCGIGPAELLHSISGMRDAAGSVPLIAKGNCGIPSYVDGAIHYHGTPELMAEYALFARDMGVTFIGGCCGTSPEHVAAMAVALKSTPPRPFDAGAMEAALGTPWANIPTQDATPSRRRNRRGRSS
ncbi:MAG: methionine synthase, partial [Alphaproteobacteria bacterium]|nr:methionine synthase [Alphaproteobacteria bacterium]